MEKGCIKIIKQKEESKENLTYWLSRPADERLEAVEILRKQFNGSSKRLQRTVRVVKQTRG